MPRRCFDRCLSTRYGVDAMRYAYFAHMLRAMMLTRAMMLSRSRRFVADIAVERCHATRDAVTVDLRDGFTFMIRIIERRFYAMSEITRDVCSCAMRLPRGDAQRRTCYDAPGAPSSTSFTRCRYEQRRCSAMLRRYTGASD